MQADFPTIFKENLALQLEATYRKNVDKVATELKRRLDYLKEVEETKQVSIKMSHFFLIHLILAL
jgi:hypothetical protein